MFFLESEIYGVDGRRRRGGGGGKEGEGLAGRREVKRGGPGEGL